jgi:hypothetical protein
MGLKRERGMDREIDRIDRIARIDRAIDRSIDRYTRR